MGANWKLTNVENVEERVYDLHEAERVPFPVSWTVKRCAQDKRGGQLEADKRRERRGTRV